MKEFKIYRVNTLPQTGRNGDQYLLRKQDNRYEAYVVQPDGTLAFNQGITDEQNSRLERLSSSQISKLEGLDNQDKLNEKFAELSGKVVAELFPIKSTGLMPTPILNGMTMDRAWSLVLEGTYTQEGKPDIVIEENELGVVSFGGETLGYTNKYTGAFADGALALDGSNPELPGYQRTSRSNPSAMVVTNDDESLFYTGKIGQTNIAGVFFYDSNLEYLGNQFNEINEWDREPIVKPVGTVYIATCSQDYAPKVESYTFISGDWELDQKILIQPSINGRISPGDDRGISGETTFNFLQNVLDVPEEQLLSFGLVRGQMSQGNNGIPNTSLNWLSTTRIPYNIEYGQINISGYGNSSGASDELLNDNRIFLFNSNGDVLGIISSPLNTTTFSFNPDEGTASFAINVTAGSNVGADVPNSPFWESLKIWTGANTSDIPDGITVKGEAIRGNINTPQTEAFTKTTTIVDQVIKETKVSDVMNISTAVGSLTLGGSAIGTPTNYIRTSITAPTTMGRYLGSGIISYTGEIEHAGIAAIWFLREDLTRINPIELPIGVYDNYEISDIPEDTYYIATCSANNPPIIKNVSTQYEIIGVSGGGFDSVYIDAELGDDENNGSFSDPVKTINKGLDILSQTNQGVLVIGQGDYRETLDLSKLRNGNYKIINREGHSVRVLGSDSIEDWQKTEGYDNIYEAAFTGSIPNWSRNRNPIFEDGNPSKLIDEKDYHPLQKNLRYRLPFTPILSVNSLEELDSTPSSYYLSGGKIYIHTTNSDNPQTNEFRYEVASRIANTINSAATTEKKVEIYMEGIQFLYHTTQVRLSGFSKTFLKNVVALASSGAGGICPNTGYNILVDCEGAYCNGDGFNGHFSAYSGYQNLSDNRIAFPTTHYINCWAHDNFDDGESSHEHHNVIMDNVLLEYNGDSGCRPSNDATYYVKDSIFRYNGWQVGFGGTAAKGEGFAVVNPVSNINRVGCRALLFNCLSYENNTGYGTISSQTNVIELINCISRDNFTAEYYAGAGKMRLRNCRGYNVDSTKLKVVQGTASIEVINEELIA